MAPGWTAGTGESSHGWGTATRPPIWVVGAQNCPWHDSSVLMLLRARGGLGNVTIMSSVCLHLSDHVLVIYRSHLTSLSICTLFTPSSMAGSRGCFHEVVVIQRWSAAQLTGLQESGIRLVPQACMGGREQCPHADDPAFHTLRLCFIGTPPIS